MSSDGSVFTAGGVQVHGNNGLSVTSGSALKGGLSLHKRAISAADLVEVSIAGSSFVEIMDDGKKSKNEIVRAVDYSMGGQCTHWRDIHSSLIRVGVFVHLCPLDGVLPRTDVFCCVLTSSQNTNLTRTYISPIRIHYYYSTY